METNSVIIVWRLLWLGSCAGVEWTQDEDGKVRRSSIILNDGFSDFLRHDVINASKRCEQKGVAMREPADYSIPSQFQSDRESIINENLVNTITYEVN
jgi:hypothetical protein